MSIKTVAIAGANGVLGRPVLEELLRQGYAVTILSRPHSSSTYPDNVKVAATDFKDKASIVEALEGQDAFISTIGSGSGMDAVLLAEAAVEAGVKRYIPSEFGSDTKNHEIRSLPFYAPKLAAQAKLEELTAAPDSKTTWTYVYSSAFLEYSFQLPIIANLKQRQITLWDGGNVEYTATSIPAVATATVNVLKNLEATQNRPVRISSIMLSQRKVLAAAQEAIGSDGWTVTEKTTISAKEESLAIMRTEPTKFKAWIMGFLSRALFAKEAGGNFAGSKDNELLGTPQVSNDELVEIIRKCA